MNPTAPPARTGHLPTLLLALVAAPAFAHAQVQLAPRWDTQIQALSSAVPIETNDIAVGDVDGDGDLDMVFALNTAGGNLFRNDGDGAFTRSPQLLGTGFHRVVALVDVDGDGDLDAFFGGGRTSYGGPGVCALSRNDGTGTFTNSATLPTAGGLPQMMDTGSVCVGDIDGDGDMDLVLCTLDTLVKVWQNDGTGAFTDVSGAAFPGGTPVASRGRLADVDGDGDLDLFAFTLCYQNDGSGHFGALAGWPSQGVEVADVDGDGDLDLLTPSQVLRNDGGLVFTPVGSLPGGYPELFQSERRVVADIDGDGLVDLIGTDHAVRPLFLRNTGGFVFQDATAAWFDPHALVDRTQGLAYRACAVFDADGDGDLDFVTGGNEGRGSTSTTVGIPPTVFLNADHQRFVDAGQPAFPWLQNTSATIAAGDIDGDGDVDLMFSYLGYINDPFVCAIWRQDRSGHFAADPTPPLAASLSAAVFVDVDGDGDLDLFGAAGVGPELLALPDLHRLARNDGNGNFTDVSAAQLPASAVSVGASCAAGDVDGDGDQDLVVGSYDPNYGAGVPLMLLTNDGNGTFTDASVQLPPLVANARWLALRDFDGDGDLDLLVANGRFVWQPAAVQTYYFENDGTGHFTDVTAARLPGSTGWGADVRDLDGDGDLDVAQSGATLWNDGTGTFTATPAPTNRLLAADFDRDGVADDVTSWYGDQLHVGGQTLPFGHQVQQHAVLAVDLDGDLDLDLVATCMLGFGNPDWSTVQIGILWNRYRDLEAVALPRVGQPYRLRVRGRTAPPGMLAVLATSPGALPTPVAIPGIDGALVVDPGTMFLWGLSVVPDAVTAVEATLPLAADPSLNGLEVATQALFVPVDGVTPMGLSNALVHMLAW